MFGFVCKELDCILTGLGAWSVWWVRGVRLSEGLDGDSLRLGKVYVTVVLVSMGA